MNLKEKILSFSRNHKQVKTQDIVSKYNISRQYASTELNKLVEENKLIKFGSTKSSFYMLPQHANKAGYKIEMRLKNQSLEEHDVLEDIKRKLEPFKRFRENVASIFEYTFSEMLNNAIEHSKSEFIEIEVSVKNKKLIFTVNDFGIGAFYNIKQKMKLNSELDAIPEIIKGKTTTNPRSHSGEGIFFTSKISDLFILESSYYQLRVDTIIEDVFIDKIEPKKRGTKVIFHLDINSGKHLNDIFKKYQASSDSMAFDKTEIKIKLYTLGAIYISRSQARRVLSGLEKFKVVILDFDKVPTVGQAFADEVFRVFQDKHPKIKLKPINMNKTVEFMVRRSKNN